jgi:hypothetical protein
LSQSKARLLSVNSLLNENQSKANIALCESGVV